MIDIKLIRETPDLVKEGIKKREMNLDSVVDEILVLDGEVRQMKAAVEALRAEQNADSKKIPQLKKEGGDVAALMAHMKELSETIKADDAKLDALAEKQKTLLLSLPRGSH